MMPQIVMSTSMPPLGPSTLISFFETFAPRVEMYRSSNWSWMNLRIRHVLPTATSPTRQTLALRCFWPASVEDAIMRAAQGRGGRDGGYRWCGVGTDGHAVPW